MLLKRVKMYYILLPVGKDKAALGFAERCKGCIPSTQDKTKNLRY